MPGAIETAIARSTRELSGWSSIKVRVKAQQRDLAHGGAFDILIDTTYIETSKGQRFLERWLTPASGKSPFHRASYCDGRKCANVHFRNMDQQPDKQETVAIQHDFMNEAKFDTTDRHAPLNMHYVGKVAIPDALTSAKHPGSSERLGRPMESFRLGPVKVIMADQLLIYQLDRATGVPLEVAGYLDDAAVSEGRPAWSWRAKSFDEVQSYHILRHSEQISYLGSAAGSTTKVVYRQEIEVESIAFDVGRPAATFWPKMQPGVDVIDEIAKTIKKAPGKVASTAPVPTAAVVVAPIRAQALEAGGWASWLPAGGLGVGAATLAVGIVLWVRRR